MDGLAKVEEAAGALDPSLRARGLALRVTGADPQPWIARGLYDPDAYVQMSVIDALPSDLAAAPIDPWLRTARDPFARAAGAVVVGDKATPETVAALGEALAAAESWSRPPLALAATAVGVEGAESVLAAELAKGEIPLEVRFVRDLSRVGHEELLLTALGEGWRKIEPELAPEWAAVELALGRPAHARSLMHAPDEDQRLAMLDALWALPSPEAKGVLTGLPAASDFVRDYARCLTVAHHDAPVRKLVKVATSEQEEVRALAMTCAGRVPADRGGALVSKILAVGLADESARVQIAAARASQERPDASLVPFLRVLAALEDPALSLEAAAALRSE